MSQAHFQFLFHCETESKMITSIRSTSTKAQATATSAAGFTSTIDPPTAKCPVTAEYGPTHIRKDVTTALLVSAGKRNLKY